MIVSASRRTDIPAFYTPWLLERLRQGYALVRNPVNPRLVYRVPIRPEQTRCLVLWSKNPEPLLPHLEELENFGIPFYFLFTLTPYGSELERNLPGKEELLGTFLELARRLGPQRVVWRYDPILFTPRYSPAAHLSLFGKLAEQLAGCTQRCIVSFLTMYNKCRRNLRSVQMLDVDPEARAELAAGIDSLAAAHGIKLQSCACPELAQTKIASGACIDAELIARISGQSYRGRKDRSQRESCLCVESADIGAYDTCLHHCLYCYANSNYRSARGRHRLHDPHSPLLVGTPEEQDRLLERKGKG